MFVVIGIGIFVFAFGIICTLVDVVLAIFKPSVYVLDDIPAIKKTKIKVVGEPVLEDFGISDRHLLSVKDFENKVDRKIEVWRIVLNLMLGLLLSVAFSKGGESFMKIIILGFLFTLPVIYIILIVDAIIKVLLGGGFSAFLDGGF